MSELKYRAFISYSHADTNWAKWLHRGLESFHIDKDLVGRVTARGAIPQALRPIFRDRDEFTAGHALAEQTLAALDDSHALIVVCSPASAKSRYVNEEVRLFKSRHPDRPVIPLIVDGKPDDPERECFPPALKFKTDVDGQVTGERIELLAADARDEGDGKNLALAKVIAGLLSVSSDEIFRRAERERRAATRRKRRVQILVGVLVSGIVLGLVGWWNQAYFRERIYWFTNVRPYLLTADAERALKPKDIFQECTDCPAMVVVPSGSFTMGSPDDPKSERNFAGPRREVTIAEPFAVGKYEVTFAEWDACVAALGCPRLTDEEWGRGERPAINLTWDEAQRYATWLTKFMGRPYRLLSETEWEYAARAGTTTLFSFGDDEAVLGEYAWYNGNSDLKTHPVGEKKPNGFGLYDVHGNVWEWVQDCWHDSYDGAPTDGSAWTTGYDCGDRVLRGGSFGERDGNLASAERYWFPTNSRATKFCLPCREDPYALNLRGECGAKLRTQPQLPKIDQNSFTALVNFAGRGPPRRSLSLQRAGDAPPQKTWRRIKEPKLLHERPGGALWTTHQGPFERRSPERPPCSVWHRLCLSPLARRRSLTTFRSCG